MKRITAGSLYTELRSGTEIHLIEIVFLFFFQISEKDQISTGIDIINLNRFFIRKGSIF